jgi:hypothetical protein
MQVETQQLPRQRGAAEASPPTASEPRHRRPIHTFRVIAILVILLGTLGGGYLLGPGRSLFAPDAPAGNTAADRGAASDLARQRATAAAMRVATLADKANDIAKRNAACAAYTGNRAIGCVLLLEAGFGMDQMPCLDNLWTRESHWNTASENKSSGAYGIPQAVPGDKMKAYGADWKTNPVTQIRWGLNYISTRYTTPCGAWSHSQSSGWY